MTDDLIVMLSEDRKSLTVEHPSEHGWLLHRFEWAQPASDELVDMAVKRSLDHDMGCTEPGQTTWTRRIPIGPFELYLHVMTGPPTWRRPVVTIKDGALLVGWLRLAVATWVGRR